MSESKEVPEKFDQWCIVELFGHVRLGGRVTEASIGGCSFLRVDVPGAESEVEFTRYLGNGAIYSMTPVTEAVARAVGKGTSQPPVKPWEMPRAALPPQEEGLHEADEGRDFEEGEDEPHEAIDHRRRW